MDQRLSNVHFHSFLKACDIIAHRQYDDTGIEDARCLTHKIEICKCGWEFRWHGGKDLRAMNGTRALPKEGKVVISKI